MQPIGTGRRAFIRSAFSQASSGWAGLTDAQRAAWESFAASHPITDSLGQSILLTGHQMYVRMATQRLNLGFGPDPAPPSDLSTGSFNPVSAAYTIGTGLAITYVAGAGTGFLTMAVSRPMSAGRSFNKTFWQPPGADGHKIDSGTSWTLSEALYSAQFGIPGTDQKIFVQLTHFSPDAWLTERAIVPAIAT